MKTLVASLLTQAIRFLCLYVLCRLYSYVCIKMYMYIAVWMSWLAIKGPFNQSIWCLSINYLCLI